MSRITTRKRVEAPELEDVFERAERALGFVPNCFFVMARSPDMLRAFAGLAREVIGVPGKVPLALKRLLARVASRATGRQYCAALRMALAAGSVPNAVTDAHMEDLKQYFDETKSLNYWA